jgi:hypothetical protein
MEKRIIAITTSAFMLLGAATSASAQSPMMQQSGQQQPPANQSSPGMMGPGMMTQAGTMGGDMMRGGMMRHGAMSAPLMRIMFALMDSDGNGTISLQEFQTAHERIFRAMDANKDGALTPDEMHSFMMGQGR